MANLRKRGMSVVGKCPMCNKEDETTLHALWECHKWKYARLEWLPRLFCVISWRIWFLRNSYVHNDSKISCFDVIWWSRNFVAECQSLVSVKEPNLMVANGIAACWRPPMVGSYKINCSAVTKVGNRRVGIGILIRNDSGLVMTSCSQVIEASFDGQVAGIMAVYRGILFNKDCRLEPCVMESDKVGAVGLILKTNPLDSKCGAILVEIANMMALCNGMTITAIPNLANRVAQGLATQALNITRDGFWMEDLPSCIRCLLEVDMPT
ncbi:hypothetical protein Dsin_015452 [Dipteronia sinensis]|uniref:RNase H type-1 domain-containing protein n=1 Tax=Dipteronia sinensis TaxID=43782 RepID=A0AAE0AB85_9ROSI|nr:hypothetical protein Dsin_015452 [Dipteronia sinensis]